MKRYRVLLLSSLLLPASAAMAMPAKQQPVEGFMADGTPVTAIQVGDENFHYYISQSDGAVLRREGELFVKDSSPRRAKSPRYISGRVPGTSFPAKGRQKVAVVLVEYQDVKFNLSDPLDYFTRMLNEEGFSDYHATGSARDWFIHSSFGQFEPEFIVMGPVTLQKNRDYYGGNDAWGQDSNPQKMVIEACRQLNAEVDFSQFDCDNDGYIDNVFVVYAGRGEASGGSSDCVWPHAWTLSSAEPGSVYSFDNVRLNRYACTNEWELSDLGYGYRPVGIGSFVHEFAHVMGLPDLYTTDYATGSFTLGAWSAMDLGPYNNDMCTPPQFSAWERAALGYIEPEPLAANAANAALEPLEEGKAYLVSTNKANEYFIIENRQQTGWDAFIPGHGMLIWHIDYDEDVWRQNAVNNDVTHNRVDIVEADGILTSATRDGDSFPGAAGVTSFTFQSWNSTPTGHALTDISEIGHRVAFRVNGGAADIATPQLLPTSNIQPASFTANWVSVTEATGYRLTLRLSDGSEETYLTKADATSFTFTGLEPSTDYAFAVAADDGCFGSVPSQFTNVTTAPPTLDYFTPQALPASDVKADGFTAQWETLDGASAYTLFIYREEEDEAITVSEDFSGNIEHLPSGFTTTSRVTYGMAAYSGATIPSLRLASDGDVITVSHNGDYISSLTFWQRGNSTSEAESIIIEGLEGDNWTQLETLSVVTAQGGQTETISLPLFTWQTVRIRFNRPAKGSVAIDDITATFINPKDLLIADYEVSAPSTSFRVSGLNANTVYKYGVMASDGEFITPESVRISVVTSESAAVDSPETAGDMYEVFDLMGHKVAQGIGTPTLSQPGIYIIKQHNRTLKVIK